jgi:hypothetical protein
VNPSESTPLRLKTRADVEREVQRRVEEERCRLQASQMPNCFSTLNHIVGWCDTDGRVIRWVAKQALHGFQGVRGNLE